MFQFKKNGNGKKVTMSCASASDKEVVGYSVLQANNMDEAVELLKGHPHLNWVVGCQMEVYESMPLPSMS